MFERTTRSARLLFAVGLLGCLGCGPTLETSPEAGPLPLLERDPAETGTDLARWPQWRGPGGQGIARGGSPPIEFGPGRNVRWVTPVPGRGNSSPVVWDDRVFLTTALDDSEPPALAVLCVDRRDGSLLWQKTVGQARGPTHDKNGYASASVATDGKLVFAFFGSTGLFALDFSGEQVWRAELGDLHHQWGTAASPVLHGDTVIQLCDSQGDSYVAAFDRATGRPVWRTERPSYGCWTTPVFVEAETGSGTRTEMIVNGAGAGDEDGRLVIAYDPASGRELWRVRGTSELVTPTLLVGDGLVYSLSGRNGPIMAIRPGGSGDVTDSRVVWKTSRGGPYIPSGVVYRNRLLLVTDNGALSCLNAGNGRTIWKAKLPGLYSASLIAADGRVYALGERGAASVFSAADRFELLAQNDLDAHCLATPAVADGDLLIRTEDELYCFAGRAESESFAAPKKPATAPAEGAARNAAEKNGKAETKSGPPAGAHDVPAPKPQADGATGPAEHAPPQAVAKAGQSAWPLFRGDALATGVSAGGLPEPLELLWTFTAEKGGFESTAAIDGGVAYVGCLDGNLYAVDMQDGHKRWAFPTELGFTASAAVRDGRVYIGDSDGRFYCIDAASGEKLWDYQTDSEINSSANFYKDTVLFGSQDMFLYCLKAATGEVVWKYESPDQIRCFPTVVEDRAFVAGCDGKLHVIDLAEGKGLAEIDVEGPTGCSPAVMGDRIFVGTEEGTLFALDWRRAKVLWRFGDLQRPMPFRSSAAVTPEAVIVGRRDKLVYALDPERGEPLWTFTTKSRVDSSPVVVGQRVLVGSSDGRIYGLDRKSGAEVWRFEAGGSVIASPAVAGGRMVIGTDTGALYCFGRKAGG